MTLSPFSQICQWRKPLKSVMTHFIRIKNFGLTSIKISLRKFSELHFPTTIFCSMESIWLNDCPDEFKPVYYKRYGNNIFDLFRSLHHREIFNEYLNTKHANK